MEGLPQGERKPRLRHVIEKAVQPLLDAPDTLGCDPDLEPVNGAGEARCMHLGGDLDQRRWSKGGDLGEEPESDFEPETGS